MSPGIATKVGPGLGRRPGGARFAHRKHSIWTIGRWAIEGWEEPASPMSSSQDQSLVHYRDAQLRLAVIDGCTPTPQTPTFVGVDGASWAASVIRAAFQSDRDLGSAIADANSYLFDATIASSRVRPQAVFVVADLHEERIALSRGGDCEAWIEHEGAWRPVFPRPMLTPTAEAAYRHWKHEHPDAGRQAMFEAEELLLGDRTAWNSTALGRFADPLIEFATVDRPFSRLVLASDGARLDADRVSNLDEWLEQLRGWERTSLVDHRSCKTHDDVTVLRLCQLP